MTYTGTDPHGYVLSVNLHRRQLTKAQASLVGARIADMPEGGNGSNQHKSNSLNLGSCISQEQAASMLGVSEKNVKKAKAMLETATPELIHLVNMPGSSLSLDAACLVATRPKEEQKEIVNEGVKAVKKAAAGIRRYSAG